MLVKGATGTLSIVTWCYGSGDIDLLMLDGVHNMSEFFSLFFTMICKLITLSVLTLRSCEPVDAFRRLTLEVEC